MHSQLRKKTQIRINSKNINESTGVKISSGLTRFIVTNRELNRNFPSREDERREIQGPTPLFYFKSLCVTLRQLFDITDRHLIYVSIVLKLRLASLNKKMLKKSKSVGGGGGGG